ncbi:MAG: type II toxin-antitoxin system VapC family toxin [Bacteroidota bacterium]|nr:type II toxin-antitoxin system VapC family toxin [Bacteroidota bacterium]
MPKYLLDTHTLMWWHEEDDSLSTVAIQTIENLSNRLYVSIVSFWEIVIKLKTDKLKLNYGIDELAEACILSKIDIIPINFYHLNQLSLLPLFHRDPFDRMLAAIAYSEGMNVVSKDKQLSQYNIPVIW